MISTKRLSDSQWMPVPSTDEPEASILERCTKESVSEALEHLDGVTVRDVSVNRSGVVDVPASWAGIPPHTVDEIPDFCSVVVEKSSPGGHVATVNVWVPLAWNGRFFGTGGAGSRLSLGLDQLVTGVRNGFATAATDGAVGPEDDNFEWQYNADTGQNDDTIITVWVHAGTHDMTVIGKAVTTAIHGSAPRYSYFHGGSGGGRQAMSSALHHPEDYDGIWSEMPALNWTRFIPSALWPALVMKELDNSLPHAKLEAFREAVVADFNATSTTDRPFTTGVERPSYDPFDLIGSMTEAGAITELDAQTMKMIWDGPRTDDGERLAYGVRPGVESWGEMERTLGLCSTETNDAGELVPAPFITSVAWLRTWVLEDPDWDWRSLDFAEYARLINLGIEKWAHVAVDNPELEAFRDSGSKLLITHGTDDQVIYPENTIQFYDRLATRVGGYSQASEFARLFFCYGQGHGISHANRHLIDLSAGMIALMDWVENGIAPDEIAPVRQTASGEETDHSLVVRYGA